ncbi:NAD(P)-dependent oxidoreductase [Xenorhabdus khoisanae]|uniref:NAD(P)-dependent oxidoreductase n=1 Tax=Xenorhabdus khoisanae TaxID=880157 RepID=UPI002358DFD9|nr:NAD(P)-dependent oxidoreductase [Xenorhabdus khoisanae]MDC9615013.1 NAD(P)-dependent oxidoreductase [Xenorhabdus khoisanae]
MSIHKKMPVIAILGTGIMGFPIAKHIHNSGYTVHAWNRTFEKAQPLKKEGIYVFSEPQDAVKHADIILTVLNDSKAVFDVLNMAAPTISSGTILIQLSTIGNKATTELALFAENKGIILYDAPVLGSKQPAENAELVILASGPESEKSLIQPIFDVIGKKTVWISDQVGQSSHLKIVLNHWVFTLTHGIAESLLLAKSLGLDPHLVPDLLKGGPLDSTFMQGKAGAMLSDNYDPSFTITNALKDAKLVAESALSVGLDLDGIQASLQRFEKAAESGHGNKDMAATYLI